MRDFWPNKCEVTAAICMKFFGDQLVAETLV